MREKQEILDRLDELCARRLKERKGKYLCREHRNCKNNRRYRVSGKGQICFCTSKEVLEKTRAPVLVCDSEDRVKACRSYQCSRTREDVEEEFHAILRDPSRCGSEYPKIAVLLWCLRGPPEPTGRKQRLLQALTNAGRHLWALIALRWW